VAEFMFARLRAAGRLCYDRRRCDFLSSFAWKY
jgi:hypothetical protein